MIQQTPPQPEQQPAHVAATVDTSATVDAAPQPEAAPAAPQPETTPAAPQPEKAAETESDSSTADDNV